MVKEFFRRKEVLFSLVALFIVIIDQLSKFLIRTFQPQIGGSFFEIKFIQNTGAGFGILQGETFLLGIVSLMVVAGVIYFYNRIPAGKFPQVFFALFLGGAIGNLIDRFVLGYVTDFLNFSFWPAFNLADTSLTIAVIGLVIYYWNKK